MREQADTNQQITESQSYEPEVDRSLWAITGWLESLPCQDQQTEIIQLILPDLNRTENNTIDHIRLNTVPVLKQW